MKFVFEVVNQPPNFDWFDVRRLMTNFETSINTQFPSIRLHLEEVDDEK